MLQPLQLRGIPRCKPTYEGLKFLFTREDAEELMRCKPTYEGLK